MLLPPDDQLVKRDTKVRGLPIVLDPDVFISLLETRLASVSFRSGRISYIRYKPGTSCLVLYELETDTRVIRVSATAYAHEAHGKIEKAGNRSLVVSPLGRGGVVFEDEMIVVSVFPNDSKIKSLARLSDDGGLKRLLSKLLPERRDLWSRDVSLMRYKPRRRFVGLLSSETQPQAVLRFYAADRYKSAKAGAFAFRSSGALTIPRVLGCSDKHRVIALEWVYGKPLNELYLNAGFRDESIEWAGASLAELHAQQSEKLTEGKLEDEARGLLYVASGMGALCPRLKARSQKLASTLIRLLMSGSGGTGAIHGDFYAHQMILDNNTSAVLDLDNARYGNPYTDLGNFIAHLEFENLAGKLSSHCTETYGEKLLLGYERNGGFDRTPEVVYNNSSLKLHTGIGLFKLASRPFRYHEPNWSDKIDRVLSRAEQIVNASGESGIRRSAGKVQQNARGEEYSLKIDDFQITKNEKMSFLSRVLAPRNVEALFADSLPIFNPRDPPRIRAVRVLSYKPGRRAVVRYDCEANKTDQNGVSVSLVGKVRAKGLDRTAERVQHVLRLNDFGETSADGISIPETVGAVPELNMWLQRYVHGQTAFELLDSKDSCLPRIAEAIYKLHRTRLPESAYERPPHTVTDELQILRRRLSSVKEAKPEWRTRLDRVFTGCENLADSLPETAPETIHRDFYGDQVILSGSRVYLIDFDLLCLGDPALDVGNFIGHIIEYSLRTTGKASALRDAELAFEDRYVELAGEKIRPAIHVYTTLTLARHIYISTQYSERKCITERLLEICRERLGSGRNASRPR